MDYSKNVLSYLAVKHQGDWDMILKNVTALSEEDRMCSDYPIELPCKTLTILDRRYPNPLRNIVKPPFVLFYYGDISLIENYEKCLAVVGTREPTQAGLDNLEKIIKGLSKDIVIVSGLARGIDTHAHKCAIKYGLKTVAVLGTGIDVCYPSENYELYKMMKESHLVLSEYPIKTITDQYHFPYRNRIISGLSKTVLIPEASMPSGTLITANFALYQNRDVCCIPGVPGTNSLCNILIQEGAELVETAQDVMDVMSFGKLLFRLK